MRRTASVFFITVALSLVTNGPVPAHAGAALSGKRCGSQHLGTAHFTGIRAARIGCTKAKRLLDRATLSENRKGATFWYHAGWTWSVQGLDEMTSRIRGKRGRSRVTAVWSAS
jgi:hypothetical protein